MPTFLNPVSGTIYLAAPGAGEFVVTSPFGPRTAPFVGFHDGIDLANGRCGDPAYSSAAGTVLNSGTDTDGAVFGIIQHPDGWRTYYWHLTAEWLTNGYFIGAGVQLGTIGSTGNSTACHLHFTIKQLVNGVYVAVDPWPLLAQNGGSDVPGPMKTYSPALIGLAGQPLINRQVPVRDAPNDNGNLVYALTPGQGFLQTIGTVGVTGDEWYTYWDVPKGAWLYINYTNVAIYTPLVAANAQLTVDLSAANIKIANAQKALA